MDRLFIFKVLLTFILSAPFLLLATVPIKKGNLIDTANYRLQDEKRDNKQKPDNKEKPNKPTPDKPEITEVPKARKQARPPVVVKPNIKVKPIKVIRPKIKRP